MSDDGRRKIRDLAALGDGQALFGLGQAHLRSRELQLAEAAFRASYAEGEERALRSLAWVVDIMGRLGEAEELYRDAIKAGDDLAALDLADMIFVQPGRASEAEDLLRDAIAGEVPTAHYVLGKLLARQPGREAEAEEAFTAEVNPDIRPHVQYELAGLLLQLPDRQADAEAALRLSGTSEACMELAAILCSRPEGREEGIALMRRAAAMGNSRAWNNLTVLLKALDRVEETVEAYADAIRSGEVGMIVKYGEFLRQLGEPEQAEAVLRQGLAHDVRCAYVLGLILLQQPGHETEARRLLIGAAASGLVAAAIQLGR